MTKKELNIFLIVTIIFLILRIYKIEADPSYISWSKGILFDPAIYSLNLKNYLINNTPLLYNNNYYLIFPGHYFLQFIFFNITNYNYLNLNLYAIILSYLSVLFFFLTLKKIYNYNTAIIYFIITTLSYVHISYSRISYTETSMIFVASIVLFLYFFKTKTCIFFCGLTSIFLVITKLNGISLVLSILFYELYKKYIKKVYNNIKLYVSGIITGIIIFSVFFIYPNINNYKELYNSRIFSDVLLDHHSPSKAVSESSITIYESIFKMFIQSFKMQNFFNTNIFYKMPVIFLLSLLFWGTDIFKKDKYKYLYLLWLLLSVLMINQSDYTPFRYRYIVLPLFYITASITIANYKKIQIKFNSLNSIITLIVIFYYSFLFREKLYYILIIAGVIISFISAAKINIFKWKKTLSILTITSFILLNTILFIDSEQKREYNIIRFNNIVSNYFKNYDNLNEITVAGYGSPVFCINTPVRSINYPNIPIDLINKLNVKYFIVRSREYESLSNRYDVSVKYQTNMPVFNETIYFLKLNTAN